MRAVTLVVISFSLAAAAQVTAPQPQPTRPAAVAAPAPPQPMDPQVFSLLSQLDQVAQAANADLGRLRIDKWKADSGVKKQAQENAESIQRNLTAALPGMMQQLRSDPQSLAAGFKLYHNLNVLYEVLSNVAESAGAFGQKNDFQALATDAQKLEVARRTLADRLQMLAANRDAELVRLRTQVQQMQAAAVPPKKIVVDNDEPKKPARKKKATKPKTDASTTSSTKPQ